MQLMIPCPLILPDLPLSLEELETAVHAWGLAIQQAALARAWQAQAALRPPVACPTCAASAQRPAGTKARRVETRFGPVRLTRQRMRCQACGRYFQPDDAALMPLLGAGQCTPVLRALAAQCGASWPYRQAAQVLTLLHGAPLAAETVRRIVAETGDAVERQYADEDRPHARGGEPAARSASNTCSPVIPPASSASSSRTPSPAPPPLSRASKSCEAGCLRRFARFSTTTRQQGQRRALRTPPRLMSISIAGMWRPRRRHRGCGRRGRRRTRRWRRRFTAARASR